MQIRNLKNGIQIYITNRSRIIDVPKSANPGKICKKSKSDYLFEFISILILHSKTLSSRPVNPYAL